MAKFRDLVTTNKDYAAAQKELKTFLQAGHR